MMVTRLWGHKETTIAELRGENEGKCGENARGGVLITLDGYFK